MRKKLDDFNSTVLALSLPGKDMREPHGLVSKLRVTGVTGEISFKKKKMTYKSLDLNIGK